MEGRECSFLAAVAGAKLEDKPFLALGAWGKRGTITLNTDDAIELQTYIDGLENETLAAGANEFHFPFVEHKMFGVHEYFPNLSKYKFLIAPKGNGIQSPKFLEALMVLTIPVTKRYGCFEQLQEYGLPIVLVDEWSEITVDLLNDVTHRRRTGWEASRRKGDRLGRRVLRDRDLRH